MMDNQLIPPAVIPVLEKEKQVKDMTEAEKQRLSSLDKEKAGVEEEFDEESATFMDDE